MKNAPEPQEITPEYVMQLGQELIDAVFQATPAEEAMKHYTAQERLAGLTPDQIRRYLEQLEKSNPQ
ncbi:MAG: hypothetical protein U1F76_13070 [Candidatus Competibacteraceae bacterium]